jgi:histidinol-phosphatase (PHP family)
MMICDSHTHSDLSIDSSASVEEMCKGALENDIPCIAFTDHYDLNPGDEGYNYFNPERFFREITNAKSMFGDQLTILKGIEFGEPHQYPEVFASYQQQGYDVIIGSIHWTGKFFVGSNEILCHYTPKAFYQSYYQVMLEAVQFGGFDILAHFDFPKRYLKTNVTDLPIIDEVLQRLIDSEIALEINTSSLRKGLTETLPDRTVLQRYAELGGTKITLGSDAHIPEDIGAGFDYAFHLLKDFPQLAVGYVEQRRFVPSFDIFQWVTHTCSREVHV